LWRRQSAVGRVAMLTTLAIAAEAASVLVQAKLPVIVDTSVLHLVIMAYLGAIALDEIDFRDLLGRISERRFHRITMSLGDGVVCTDHNGTITVWNPGATAIFGYEAREMMGRPLALILVDPAAEHAPVVISDLMKENPVSASGTVIELG